MKRAVIVGNSHSSLTMRDVLATMESIPELTPLMAITRAIPMSPSILNMEIPTYKPIKPDRRSLKFPKHTPKYHYFNTRSKR